MLGMFPSLQAEELLCSAVTRYADMMAFPQPEKALRKVFGLSLGTSGRSSPFG